MNNSSGIRLLAPANNERGDLFTRLMRDLFFALGYDNLRLDVHKSGRELDIQGVHRFEPRRIVGECKAHAAKMGGDELNKFFGSLARERIKYAPNPVAGYFVSLGGFTETGIEQEIETGDGRIILLDANKVVDELERCRVIVGRTEAAERAGHCAQYAGLRDAEIDGTELLGHQCGYLWAIFYAHGKERTHFVLIHAEGIPLAETVAAEVIDADRLCGGYLHSLRYIASPAPTPDRITLAAKADARYRQWIGEECGYIHLDGMPADSGLSATRLRLERLFVPLKVTYLSEPDDHPDLKQTLRDMVMSIGEVLERSPHLALLAMPGGGKSTLVKRLATAYAFPERRSEVSDDLPQQGWLPLILRCRELRDRAHRPIIELLDDIPRHAGMNADECDIFRDSIHGALRTGNALLLVDGLDEITDEGARQVFAKHLRTFLAMFPQVVLVVTSREAGFRLVAGVIASACTQVKLAPLDEDDVLSLCERWHVEVVGNTDKVRGEAKALGETIWGNPRIRALTENPLLLTTLLVVKRWVGDLPRSRAGLYREAVRVLVRTWNVEGYAPLDEDETLAQLSYVACAMMENGAQQIGQKALLNLLQNARRELEAELRFARISPQEFIERIEYRSSLIMQTGHEFIDDVLQPVFEFRHLTFQEYLAARGYVEEQYPGRDSGQSLADLIESHFEDKAWNEVIPLAAVLAGRKAEEIMKRLVVRSQTLEWEDHDRLPENEPLGNLLLQCLIDEVQVTAPTLLSAIREVGKSFYWRAEARESWAKSILQGKFSTVFQEEIHQIYLAGGEHFELYGSALATQAVHRQFGGDKVNMPSSAKASLLTSLESGDRLDKIHAALVCMRIAWGGYFSTNGPLYERELRESIGLLYPGLIRMLDPTDLPSALAASWALAWIGEHRFLTSPPEPEVILSLYHLWRQQESVERGRYFAWALASQQLLPRETFSNDVWGNCDSFLSQAITNEVRGRGQVNKAALIVGWYRRSPWNDVELVDIISKSPRSMEMPRDKTIIKLLESLGEAGALELVKWKNMSRSNRRQPVRRGSL